MIDQMIALIVAAFLFLCGAIWLATWILARYLRHMEGSIQSVHVIVNSQKTEMLDEITALKREIVHLKGEDQA